MSALYPRLLALARALGNPDVTEPDELTVRRRDQRRTEGWRVVRPQEEPPVTGEDLSARLLDQCLSLSDFDGGAVLLSDADRSRLFLSAYDSLPPELLQIMAAGSDPLGLLDKLWGPPELIELAQHPSRSYRTALNLFAFRQLMLLPVQFSEAQPGIVLVVSKRSDAVPPGFTPQFLEETQRQFQGALDHLHLRGRMHRNLGRYRAVEAGLSALGRSANPESLLQSTCDEVRRIFRATIVWIGLIERGDHGAPSSVAPTKISGGPPDLLAALRKNLLAPKAPTVLLTAIHENTVVFQNTTSDDILLPAALRAARSDEGHPLHRLVELDAMTSTLAAPMQAGGELVGVLVLHQDRSYRFDTEDHRVVRIFAQEAALAIRTQALLDDAQSQAEALRQSEGLYRSFVRQISDAMFRLSPGGDLEEVSDFGVDLLGQGREALLGRPLEQMFAGADRQAVRDALDAARQGQSSELALNLAVGDAEARVAVVRMGPLMLGDRVAGIIGVGRDDTDRRALQGKLLMREKLASVGLLSAGVAHEIYNPLSFLVSNLDTLSEDLRADANGAQQQFTTAERLEMLAECRDGTERIHSIVSNLRLFSLEGSDLDFRSTDINQTVESATWMVYLRARLRTHVALDLDPTLEEVECLPGQIVQAVAQLLSNAIHASLLVDRTAPEVRLKTSRVGDYVEIRVTDRGCGIPADELLLVVEPFYTTNNSTGAGVGLTLVLEAAERHGGLLRLRSSPGSGTSAVLVIPTRQAPELRLPNRLDLGASEPASAP